MERAKLLGADFCRPCRESQDGLERHDLQDPGRIGRQEAGLVGEGVRCPPSWPRQGLTTAGPARPLRPASRSRSSPARSLVRFMAVATAPTVRDSAPSTGPAPTYTQVQALVDAPGITWR